MTIIAEDWHDLKGKWNGLIRSVKVGVTSAHNLNIFHTADHNGYSMATIIDNNHFEQCYTEKKCRKWQTVSILHYIRMSIVVYGLMSTYNRFK